jgi:hypothetical protein
VTARRGRFSGRGNAPRSTVVRICISLCPLSSRSGLCGPVEAGARNRLGKCTRLTWGFFASSRLPGVLTR